MSVTPTYDAVKAAAAALPYGSGKRGNLSLLTSKAITAGQRAGERAVAAVWRPYEYEPLAPRPADLSAKSDAAASAASAKAREAYCVKALKVGFVTSRKVRFSVSL